MENRIILKKLLFLHHLANLDDSSLAKEIYNVQLKLGLPGLISECEPHLVKLGVIDITKLQKFSGRELLRNMFQKRTERI